VLRIDYPEEAGLELPYFSNGNVMLFAGVT